MRDRWRGFARSDPMHYIDTREEEPWTKDEFFAAGRDVARDVLAWAGNDLRRDRMLDIGCGMGRMLVHFAPYFERVDGVDIAPEMIEQARESGLPANVHVEVSSGADLSQIEDRGLDFVFSFLVFQHIPEPDVIRAYLKEVGRVLRPSGKAALQFDTRPKTLASRIAYALPDFMLPRSRRSYIRRYRRSREELMTMVQEAGLVLESERDPNTEVDFLLLRPA
jgi:SAM-dependent methyltransferase